MENSRLARGFGRDLKKQDRLSIEFHYAIIFLQISRKKVQLMPTITPISDLRNYGNVLDKVREGSPVYLTRNGHGAYCIRDMKDEENFKKAEAMIQLMSELNAGIRSADDEGWISEEEFADHFRSRRNGAK